MLRELLVLVFTTISVTNCDDNCPLYSAFTHYKNSKDVVQSMFDGTFTLAYTTTDKELALNCHQVKYEIDANGDSTGYSEFPKCCLKLDNIEFNENQINYTIGGVNGKEWCPWVIDGTKGSMKVLATTGTGFNICFILAVCEPEYYGLMVMCRGIVPKLALIVAKLLTVVGSLAPAVADVLALQAVSLASCFMESNYCF